MLASAMMETGAMDTNYPYGDNKTADSFNAGVCKQNWGMMRECHPAWQGLGPQDYETSATMNGDWALDVQVYNECRAHFGDNWWRTTGRAGIFRSPDFGGALRNARKPERRISKCYVYFRKCEPGQIQPNVAFSFLDRTRNRLRALTRVLCESRWWVSVPGNAPHDDEQREETRPRGRRRIG